MLDLYRASGYQIIDRCTSVCVIDRDVYIDHSGVFMLGDIKEGVGEDYYHYWDSVRGQRIAVTVML